MTLLAVVTVVASSHWVAFAALVTGLVLAFIFGIAWMRPTGYHREHHPSLDDVVDDVHP